MSPKSMVLRGGTVVTSNGEEQMDVQLAGGKIVGLGHYDPSGGAADVIDVRGKYVVPGFIDGHVHLREMQYSDREDFLSGTQAAAVGGITTVMDMPNSKPNVITPDDLIERQQRAAERAYVNIGLYVWACAKNVEIIPQFAALGPIAFKIFTAETGAYDPEFANYITTEPSVLYRILEKIASIDSIAAIHSESQSLIAHLEQAARKLPPDLRAYLQSRPQAAEDVAVFSEVAIARQVAARVHICHVVGKGAVDFIRWSKKEYYDGVTCEAAPHNLLMNAEQTIALGSMGKFSPPVQAEDQRLALWEGLLDGTIDIIGSDHAPQHFDKKCCPDIWKASPGSPALDYWISLMLTCVSRGTLTMAQLVRAASENPAKVFGLFPNKGSIRIGADADIVVVDMQKRGTVRPEIFKSKAKYSAFDGWPTEGAPVMTIVGGVVVAKDGQIVGHPGTGRVVSRARQAEETARALQTA